MNKIKFTSDHKDKIKSGKKTSTLRTVKKKNLYKAGSIVRIDSSDLRIHIQGRELVEITPSTIRTYDDKKKLDREKVVNTEGFRSWEELIEWFEDRNYNIPQPMWLYTFEKPSNVDSNLRDYQ